MSMTQVAKLAGVSQATVSRVVAGSDKVSEDTRIKVEAAMKDLGFVPKAPQKRKRRSRKAVVSSAVKLIAVLVTEHSLERHSGFVLKMFRGAREAAQREGVSVWLGNIRDSDDVAEMVKAVGADGVLLAGVESLPGISRQTIGKPVVWLTSHADAGADAILPGNEAAGKMAADYLLERGHQSLAFLNVDDRNPSYEARGEAFVKRAKAGGGQVQQIRVTERDCNDEKETMAQLEGRVDQAVKKMLHCKERVTGLFVPSDLMTSLVYRALHRCGVKPGKDLDIISCDHEEAYLAGLSPRPATIDIAGEERGRRAVYELLVQSRFPEEQRPVQLTIEPQLVVGENVG
ncbi:MAG: LacI family transcriptional regulator [Verrucomicrobiales bacterium]|nr:LacI family transcriptional regulator [Verrucomicrobiales bacterium]